MIKEIQDKFKNNGYVHLQGFLDTENCKQLSEHLKTLVENNKTNKDEQCPLSDAIYGDSIFDELLEKLTPNIETATGKRLIPTYTYARLYKNGEVLKPHTDRYSCEISATITLDFSHPDWSIYMADQTDSGEKITMEHDKEYFVKNVSEIKMGVGDAVVYKGMEKIHWRNEFNGDWQAQVFLHYVDADGSNVEWKYDKREKLSHHEDNHGEVLCWVFENAIPDYACKKLIESAEVVDGEKAGIGGDINVKHDLTIRDVNRISLPIDKGIGATLAGMGLLANSNYWNFQISKQNQCDYLKYEIGGHYAEHIDTMKTQKETRKLTVLAFLNNDFEGGKLYLKVGAEKFYPKQDAGTVIVFPSFYLHCVEPVTKGIRRSIVTWLVGDWFK